MDVSAGDGIIHATSIGTRSSSIDELLDMFVAMRPPWMNDGLCRQHPELDWFAEGAVDVRPHKAVCAACTVRDDCSAFAAANREPYGVWAGLTAGERAAAEPQLVVSGVASHGTRLRFRQGCRCEPCRRVEEQRRERREATRNHGSASSYTDGCRCEECTEAARARMASYRARAKAS